MPYPTTYQVFAIPKVLILACYGIDYLRNLFNCLLRFLGLAHPVEYTLPSLYDRTKAPGFKSLSAPLMRELLPAVCFGDLRPEKAVDDCVVCLCEFREEEEVRQLRGCDHVFHRRCLDRWLDCDKQTCPLCRAHLVPEEMRNEFEKKLWAAEEALYFDGLETADTAERGSSF
ncbi:Homeobox protein B-H1 [Asimina triloba]